MFLEGEFGPPFRRAIAAGCDDPLVLYWYLHFYAAEVPNGRNAYIRAAEALRSSKYSALHKSRAYMAVARNFSDLADPKSQALRTKYIEESREELVAAMKEEGEDLTTRLLLSSQASLLQVNAEEYKGDPAAGFDFIDAAFARAPKREACRLVLKGQFMLIHAWRARGEGVASTVTPEGARLMRERLLEAQDNLRKSWELDKEDSAAATQMIEVLKGLGADRSEVKLWFDRAMQADPFGEAACQNILEYLDARWHGSPAEVVAFGRECAKAFPQSKLPLLALDAHMRVVLFKDEPTIQGYLQSAEVRKDVDAIYQAHFARYPKDGAAHAKYAFYCAQTGRVNEASDHYQQANGAMPVGTIWPRPMIEESRRRVYSKVPPMKR
jgi:hypothetical protein